MAITTLKTEQIVDVGLNGLFAKHTKHWLTHAKRACDYMAQMIERDTIHPDDLIPVLVPALELDDKLRDFLDENRLRQKYWFTNVAEYIVDELWDKL